MDIAPQTEQVGGIDIYGIALEDIAILLKRFPDLQTLTEGKQLTIEQIKVIAPDAVAAIIAMGCGHSNDKTAEKKAARLPLELQRDMIIGIGKLTFPSGVRPFVQWVTGLGAVSVKPLKAPATNSQAPSKPLSQGDTPPLTSGL